ncbi:MAG: hypothetical protein M3Y13_07025, partial [Armatimonadota bacterium]|nr:hypothetical protein [Armatimonadota bacterium]
MTVERSFVIRSSWMRRSCGEAPIRIIACSRRLPEVLPWRRIQLLAILASFALAVPLSATVSAQTAE